MAYPTISCYPPLGQLSFVPYHQSELTLTIFVEWSASRPDFPLEVVLCYSDSSTTKHPSQWTSIVATRSTSMPSLVRSEESLLGYLYATFTCDLDIKSLKKQSQHLLFTFKYRVNSFAPWQWQYMQVGTPHGELIFQSDSSPQTGSAEPSVLATLFSVQDDWVVKGLKTSHEVDGLFCITSSHNIPRSSPDYAKMEDSVLGTVINPLRFMSLIRLEPYWIGARQGDEFFFLTEDAVTSSFLTKGGKVITFLAFNGVQDVYTVFRSGEDGQIVVSSRNDSESEASFQLLAAVSSNIEDSIAAVMSEARSIVNQSPKIQQLAGLEGQGDQSRNNDDWYDGLAYCTWNGIGQALTTEKLISGLQTMKTSGVKVSTLLIDDNWQTIGRITDFEPVDGFFKGWQQFEANKDISPNGMKGLVSRIRQEHPYLNDIGVWHALYGYWGGLGQENKFKEKYKTIRTDTKLMGNTPAKAEFIHAEDVDQFYNDFYEFLSSSGIDFVKTDVQHMSGEFSNTVDRRAFPSAYQAAWTRNYSRYFNGKAISCMSQIPQNLFYSLLQSMTPPILLRNSDDFYPEVPASHPWHIWVNAHNSLLTQHLNVLPDWDMFQTSHDFSAYHAAARCISGGPIFITDVPGEHDLNLLNQMIAPSPTGRSIALRPGIAKTTSAWEKYTDGYALRIASSSGNSQAQTGILGLFNIADNHVDFLVSATEFPVLGSDRVMIRSHRTNQLFGPLNCRGTSEPESLIQESLPTRNFDILTAYPVLSPSPQSSVAVLGLLGKMTGIAAVTYYELSPNESAGFRIMLKLKAVGVLGIWFSQPLLSVRVKIQEKEVSVQNIKTVDIKNGGKVCEINVQSFWEMNDMFEKGHKSVDLEIDFV